MPLLVWSTLPIHYRTSTFLSWAPLQLHKSSPNPTRSSNATSWSYPLSLFSFTFFNFISLLAKLPQFLHTILSLYLFLYSYVYSFTNSSKIKIHFLQAGLNEIGKKNRKSSVLWQKNQAIHFIKVGLGENAVFNESRFDLAGFGSLTLKTVIARPTRIDTAVF